MRKSIVFLALVLVTSAVGAAIVGCSHHDATPAPGYAVVSMDNGSGIMPYILRDGSLTLIKDLSPSSHPYYYTRVGGKIFFVAANAGLHYCQLWVTDGTSAGTTMIQEFSETGGSIGYLTPFNDNLVFRANDGVNGLELWMTDGTVAGTRMVKDINPGSNGGAPQQMTLFDGKLYFAANDGTHDYELWVSDGTEAGTLMLKDIKTTAPANGGSVPNGFTLYKGKLYFSASPSSSAGPELWVTDGTAPGTVSAKDVLPLYMKVVNDILFISSTDGLWISDGTGAGTVLVKALGAGAYDLASLDGKLFFRGTADGTNWDIWSSNGTTAGTAIVKAINASGNAAVSNLGVASGRVFFQADDGTHGTQLWSTDGTETGTTRVTGVNVSGGGWDPVIMQRVEQNDHFALISGDMGATYLAGDDGTNGRELWVLDGSTEGAHIVSDFNPGAPDGFWLD